jgi:hypothetical protein
MTFTAIIPVLVLCPMLLITLSSLHRILVSCSCLRDELIYEERGYEWGDEKGGDNELVDLGRIYYRGVCVCVCVLMSMYPRVWYCEVGSTSTDHSTACKWSVYPMISQVEQALHSYQTCTILPAQSF